MQDDKCRAPAEQVDHVMRLAEGGDQRDWDLLQSLCQLHHDAKTRRGREAREDPSAMTEQHRGQRSLRPLPLLTLPLNTTMPRMPTMSWVAAKPIVPMKMMM